MSQIPTSEITMCSDFSLVSRRQKMKITVFLPPHYPFVLLIIKELFHCLFLHLFFGQTPLLTEILKCCRQCYRYRLLDMLACIIALASHSILAVLYEETGSIL